MAKPVTDPALLAQLEGGDDGARKPVKDPALLAQLEGAGEAKPSGEPKGWMQSADDLVRALANGMTFGLADRFAAAAGSTTGIGGKSGDYAGNLEAERKKTDTYREEHPIVSTAANLSGGAILPLGAIGAAAKGASLGAKTLLSAGAGAGIGGFQGAAESKDWTDLPQVAKDAALGAGGGFVVGGAIPGAAKIIGSGVSTVANAIRGKAEGMSRGASNHLVSAMEADTPSGVKAQIDRLGPEAMLADTGPAMLGKAQGASLLSDEARTTLTNALTDRNNLTNYRIQRDVDRALGPAEDPQTVTNAIRAHRLDVDNVSYPAAVDRAPPVMTGPIMAQLEDMIPNSVGLEQRALTNLRDMMTRYERRQRIDPVTGHPEYDARGMEVWDHIPVNQDRAHVLHKVKQELDNVIEHDAPGLGVPAAALTRQQFALKQMRHELNAALEEQVPGYAAANRASAALAQRADAVDLGTQYLGNGKTIASPSRFEDQFQLLDAGQRIAFAKGSRGNIDRVLGTKANDLEALRSELQGEGGWNAAKLATVHGEDAASDLIATVDRNKKFRETHGKVVENSQTELRRSAREAMKPTAATDMPLIHSGMTLPGIAAAGVKKGVNAIANALLRTDPTRSYGEVANILSSQGHVRDWYYQSIVDAMARRAKNDNMSSVNGDRGAAAAGTLANELMRDRTRRQRQ